MEHPDARRVSVVDLRDNLKYFIRLAETCGKSFTICRHGRPVALLTPIQADDDE